LCGILQFLQKNKGGKYIAYTIYLPPSNFVCHLANFVCHLLPTWHFTLPQRWHINATLHLFLPPRGNFRATIAACNANKMAYQCHTTFIFATVWQFRATIATFNAKKVAYQCHPTFISATAFGRIGIFYSHFLKKINGDF
jgi:hypothetical protein